MSADTGVVFSRRRVPGLTHGDGDDRRLKLAHLLAIFRKKKKELCCWLVGTFPSRQCHRRDSELRSRSGALTENSSRGIITGETGLAHTRTTASQLYSIRNHLFHQARDPPPGVVAPRPCCGCCSPQRGLKGGDRRVCDVGEAANVDSLPIVDDESGNFFCKTERG